MPGETRVLLVEDNDMNMEMLSRSLKRKKFSVLEAVDGQQGANNEARVQIVPTEKEGELHGLFLRKRSVQARQ